jgi:UDP-glucose 4-epimerase
MEILDEEYILVTGGAGYIGSHTIVVLLENNYNVVVIDNLVNSNIESIVRIKELTNCGDERLHFYNVDLCNKNALDEVFIRYDRKLKACIHTAGLKAVGESVEKPLLYYNNNLVSTLNLLELLDKYGCYQFVFSSSSTVYGSTHVPITENTQIGVGITNPYGRTKYMLEEVLHDYYKSKNLENNNKWSIVILRYFNPTGAHDSGRIGEDPNGIPNNLMPYIAQVAIGKREKLTIFGDQYNTHDGTCIRDYIHVVDLAEGHVSSLNYMKKGSKGDGMYSVFNLGTGCGYSVLEMVNAMKKASNREIPYIIGKKRDGDVDISYADNRKAIQELNWIPKRDLQNMCDTLWKWQSNNPNGYNSYFTIF